MKEKSQNCRDQTISIAFKDAGSIQLNLASHSVSGYICLRAFHMVITFMAFGQKCMGTLDFPVCIFCYLFIK